ncbi:MULTISPECIES: hypothetical protein [Aerosakkonema]|uniref:hypothetical protein n=1 Tax=Aerosakkonema TaxID=1246629 RepID=UPI0035BB14D6
MLTHHRKPVCLSLVSTDLPIWSVVETSATIYQKDRDRFHLLLSEPPIHEQEAVDDSPVEGTIPGVSPRLLWLEISPRRVIMTMQGNGKLSYRHLWENGVYGLSRYWLHTQLSQGQGQIRLRNLTTDLTLEGRPLPEHLRVEYELWSEKVQLGRYILNLEIHH